MLEVTEAHGTMQHFALSSVARGMAAARRRWGRYPDRWCLLAEADARRLHRYDDAFPARPPPGNRWEAEALEHAFVIERADEQGYSIRGVDRHGRVTWELDERGEPAQRLPMYCSLEPKCRDDEPEVLLWKARSFFAHFFEVMGRYPLVWSETRRVFWDRWSPIDLHWSYVEHFQRDPDTMAPADATTSWRPVGSAYTYLLTSDGRTFNIRSVNDDGLPDHQLASSHIGKGARRLP